LTWTSPGAAPGKLKALTSGSTTAEDQGPSL